MELALKVHIDYETKSVIDLKKAGVDVYAKHPTTEMLCMAWCIDDGPVHLLKYGQPLPDELRELFLNPDVLVAGHNASFEFYIYNFICVPKYGWPPIPISRFDCTMIRGYAMGLPGHLSNAAMAAGLKQQKDLKGQRVMLQLCKPRSGPLENCYNCQGTGVYKNAVCTACVEFYEPHTAPEKFETLYTYCKQDIFVEREYDKRILPLSKPERKVWELDQKINYRGVFVDRPAILKAIKIVDVEKARLNDLMQKTTKNQVATCNASISLKDWLNTFDLYKGAVYEKDGPPSTLKGEKEQGILKWYKGEKKKVQGVGKDILLDLVDMIKAMPSKDISPAVKNMILKAIEIRQEAAKSSTAKLKAMIEGASPDGRVRGCFQYYGAASTGRWCLTGDHEVLTKNGWVTLEKWREQDAIACYNKDTEKISFQKSNKIAFNYAGPMFSVSNDFISFKATPEHKILHLNDKGRLTESRAIEISKKAIKGVKLSGNLIPAYKYSYRQIKSKILVMTQADGHFQTNTRSGRLLRFKFKKQRKIKRCKSLLNAAKIDFKTHTYPDGVYLTIPWRNLPSWLANFSDKKFGSWCLTDLCLDSFISEVQYWDGNVSSPRGVEYSTIVKSNADWVVTIAHLTGRRARMVIKKRQDKNWSTVYRVYINENAFFGVKKSHWRKESFNGKVFCANTKTGFFIVRHNGKIHITGNSGRRIQLQNLVRPTIKQNEIEEICERLSDPSMSAEDTCSYINIFHGAPTTRIADCLRAMIIAPIGKKLIACDFSSIEGRGLAWLAGEEKKLNIYRSHGKIYEASACQIYGLTNIDDVTKDQRLIGKVAELACGYQGGVGAFQSMAKVYFIKIPDSKADQIKKAWRIANPAIVNYWYALERAAHNAVQYAGEKFAVGPVGRKVVFLKRGSFLFCKLPSGRAICYPYPKMKMLKTPWGEMKNVLTYKGDDNYQFVTKVAYGGLIAENITQATCRDILAEALFRVEAAGYPITMHVHDEIVCEVDKNFGSLDEVKKIMCQVPNWAKNFPIQAEGWVGKRYRK